MSVRALNHVLKRVFAIATAALDTLAFCSVLLFVQRHRQRRVLQLTHNTLVQRHRWRRVLQLTYNTLVQRHRQRRVLQLTHNRQLFSHVPNYVTRTCLAA